MALKKCKECGNKISTKALACPQCGAVCKKKTGCLGYVGLIFLIAIVIAIISSVCNNVTNKSSPRKSPTTSSLPSAEQLEAAISASDDFVQHREAFMTASQRLLREKKCTLEHLRENGGWVRSQTHKNRSVYFTYCGRPHVEDRIYLDVSTGKLFK